MQDFEKLNAEGEYGFYAHLVEGSICLKPDEHVKKVETIGLFGHTGHSSEPHLHFHLQDDVNFFLAMGLPIRFEGIGIDGEVLTEPSHIERGARVKSI